MRSISYPISVCLTAATIATSLFAYGWLYWEAVSSENAVRQSALLDQAKLIAGYLSLDERGAPVLHLPPRLVDGYKSSPGHHRYTVRDQNGQVLFGSGEDTGPLPLFRQLTQTMYDYDPDGPGPLQMFGAAVKPRLAGRIFFDRADEEWLHV